MASAFLLTLCLGMLAVCSAAPVKEIRWCVKSEQELKKCKELSQTCASDQMPLTCVHKTSTDDCFKAIADGSADAITLDSGDIYRAARKPYNLQPIVAENYGTEKEPDTCYYAVALVKDSSTFMFNELKGKRSCHTGVGRMAGWRLPIGALVKNEQIIRQPDEDIEKAVASFFSASCAPGAKEEKLCAQCAGKGKDKCKQSERALYYGYEGARRCLKDGQGDVAFVKHVLPPDFQKGYQLLCLDGTRKAVSGYEQCHWGRVPAHAVVSGQDEGKIQAITEFLVQAKSKQGCKLFGSSHGKDLMFKDSSTDLIPLPKKLGASMYLGQEFIDEFRAQDTDITQLTKPNNEKIRWCTQGKEEKSKCDIWSVASNGAIECVEASTAEDCIVKILKGEADAATLDGGYLHTAGACGLVPAMTEIYDASECKGTGTTSGSYYAVAIIKAEDKDDITWNNLKGKKSCHTGIGRTAGWNVPAGLIHKQTGICDLTTFFSESCAPGADPASSLCKLCAGGASTSLENTKCSANNRELYYGYHGALRCLVEADGDVAFVKQSSIFEAINDNPAWLKNKKLDDFRLLCRDDTVKPVSEYKTCHLAEVPAHAVATLAGRKQAVVSVLEAQQLQFGKKTDGSDQLFKMYSSEGRRDQLFKDSTECLREVKVGMNEFLGKEYTEAVDSLNQCSKSELLKACTFHTCKMLKV